MNERFSAARDVIDREISKEVADFVFEEIENLHKALDDYAQHSRFCGYTHTHDDGCDCGLIDTLEALGGSHA